MMVEPTSDLGDTTPNSVSVVGRELLTTVLWTVLADVLIFRSFGWSGPGLFFVAVPLLFFLAGRPTNGSFSQRVTIWLLLAVAARLVWAGSTLTALSGIALLVALSMSAAGYVPHVLDGCLHASRVLFVGIQHIARYRLPPRIRDQVHARGRLLAWLLPVAATGVFGAIFIFANPDLLASVWDGFERLAQRFEFWLQGISVWEVPFCISALLIGTGLMYPTLPLARIGPECDVPRDTAPATSPLYAAYRNTLAMLILLFGVYLIFEFATLWKHDFPTGFYYAGYAHQGAAWLTIALGLATAVLSIVFGGSIRADERRDRLRWLAWIWSAQNVLLAVAVYNRLMIYVGYNGMTRLRTVGFFGITLVVVGFALVLIKIRHDHGFWWLIRIQLIALALAAIAFSLFPVDYVAHRYNVAMVQSGYLHPSVMIAAKPIDDEGMLSLFALAECDDPIIRDGALAILARRQSELSADSRQHWTQFQGATEVLRQRLIATQTRWSSFSDSHRQDKAINAFRQYSMRWY